MRLLSPQSGNSEKNYKPAAGDVKEYLREKAGKGLIVKEYMVDRGQKSEVR